jgi:cell division protein FtsI/penicillin-binding protein 2
MRQELAALLIAALVAACQDRTPRIVAEPDPPPPVDENRPVKQEPDGEAPAERSRLAGTACPQSLTDQEGHLQEGLDPGLENHLQRILDSYLPPGGAVVVMEPATGRLVAAVGRFQDTQDRDQALRATYLAGSTIKVVTTLALLERGHKPEDRVCYRKGGRFLSEDLLVDSPEDKSCTDLMGALGKSLNVPFGKWASRELDGQAIANILGRLGFKNEQGLCYGSATVPDDKLGQATLASGLGNARLSAWHGAVLASIVANRGSWPTSLGGKQVIQPGVCEATAYLMGQTVFDGTGKSRFARGGEYKFGSVNIAGKTGTRSEGFDEKWREVTWFIGFAPLEKPRYAVAAVIENRPTYRAKAIDLALEAFKAVIE